MRRLALLVVLALLPRLAAAQETASLVADRVEVQPGRVLVALGRVEVLYDGTRLSASRITYRQTTGRLVIDGPITLTDAEGRVLVLADQAELDDDLENGILRSARLVLDRQLQLAAARIDRVEGRYTRLTNSVASSCEVCAANPTPTWEIRAREIVHDRQERQLYFDRATFRLFGVPVLYFPQLRLPDPTLKRTSGFLIPRVRSNSQLGLGLKVPYFLTLGDHADVTLTPYVSPQTLTLELGYRQMFRNGSLDVAGAVSEDTLADDGRYFLFADGRFDLPRDFKLDIEIEKVSDRAYLLDYDFSGQDRLASEIRISRARRRDLFLASLTDFETLRDAEAPISDQLPGRYGLVDYQRRIPLRQGALSLGIDAAGLTRESRLDGAGRDVDRVGASLDWTNSLTTGAGILAEGQLGIVADAYRIEDDDSFEDSVTRVIPRAALTLRWPFTRTGPTGRHALLEPVAHLAWSEVHGDTVPNEDSTLVEFDEGNLLSPSRFPGRDAQEDGARLSLGVRYALYDPSGWSLGVTVGKILRAEAAPEFTEGTGLAGTDSDWLAATQLRLGDRLDLTNRVLFDAGFDFTRNEARLGWRGDGLDLSSTYVWAVSDPAENRPDTTHELAFDAARRLSRHWTGRVGGRFDFTTDSTSEAGVGLEYRTECIVVDVSLSRRYTASDNVEPSTDFGVRLALAGFGQGRNDASYRKVCRGPAG